jgi:putative FmdB family regulatory protein
MPTYVYRCQQCGHRFEAWQHMSDDPLTTCPQCQGAVQRVLFPASVLFKGSGFYSTDSRAKSSLSEAPKTESNTESPKTTETPAKVEANTSSGSSATSSSSSNTTSSAAP